MRIFAIILLLLLEGPRASATPEAAAQLCEKYPAVSGCSTAVLTSCGTCHASPPTLNAFGLDIRNTLGGPLTSALKETLSRLETADSDGDGSSNLDELQSDGAPGNKAIQPMKIVKMVYDPVMVFKRVKALYCGESAQYEDVQKIAQASDAKPLLHDALTSCLKSKYWTEEALHRMADRKIQPLASVGYGGNVVIADFRWDYRLFAYIMSEDRDARELLSATYHIDESGRKVEGKQPRGELPQVIGQRLVIAGGQPLAPDRRLGMITTQWFLAFYGMFASLPRNTASQAYREYLGLDIAKGEGLSPIPNEPRDVDSKNVKQKDCAVCHSTLDPLTYAFSTYRGIETGLLEILQNASGTYDSGRQPWEADGYLFGKKTADLRDWAEQARNSDMFKQNLVRMMYRHALSREPLPGEAKEFEALWRSLPDDAYSYNKLIHRFIETFSFGGRAS